MAEPFIGQIIIAGFNFAPRGYALCHGQLLSISTNTALFSLLGTTYGGDGRVTFGLPDLRGRVALHQGQGPGLTNHTMGEMSGTETVTLLATQMPMHTHALNAATTVATSPSPTGAVLTQLASRTYAAGPATTTMSSSSIGIQGGSQPHENMQPYLVVNFCIATQGIFPSRN